MPSEDYDLSSQTHREQMFAVAYVPMSIERDGVDDDEFDRMTTPRVIVDSDYATYVVLVNDPDMTDHYVLRRVVTHPSDGSPTFEYTLVDVFSSECHENMTTAVMRIAQAMMRDDATEAFHTEYRSYRQGFLDATRRVREHPELPDHDPDPYYATH